MGLFTYDITLEHVSGPGPVPGGGGSPSGASVEGDGSATTTADEIAAAAASGDLETFSHAGYDNEFDEHPDLVKCDAFHGIVMVPGLVLDTQKTWSKCVQTCAAYQRNQP